MPGGNDATPSGFFERRPLFFAAILCCFLSAAGFAAGGLVWLVLLFPVPALLFLLFRKAPVPALIVFAIVLAVTLSSQLQLRKIETCEALAGRTVSGEFAAISCDAHETYFTVTARVYRSDTLPKNVKVVMYCDSQAVQSGELFTANLKIREPDPDFKLQNYGKGVYCTAAGFGLRKTGRTILGYTYAGKVSTFITRTLFSRLAPNESATLCALTYGNRQYLSEEFSQEVRNCGVSHMMVVSGMHLSIIVGFVIFLSGRLSNRRKAKAILSGITILLISWICGFTVSILRAGFTTLMGLSASYFKRDKDPENSLGVAVCILLILSPNAVFDLSFRLSVCSAFAVMAAAPRISAGIPFRGKLLSAVLDVAVLTLCATFFTLPDTVYSFGFFSAVSLPANLLLSFAVSLSLPIAVTALLLQGLFPSAAAPLFAAEQMLLRYINLVIARLGSYPFAVVPVSRSIAPLSFLPALLVLLFLLYQTEKAKNTHLFQEKTLLLDQIKRTPKKPKKGFRIQMTPSGK